MVQFLITVTYQGVAHFRGRWLFWSDYEMVWYLLDDGGYLDHALNRRNTAI